MILRQQRETVVIITDSGIDPRSMVLRVLSRVIWSSHRTAGYNQTLLINLIHSCGDVIGEVQ